jgi:predicted alpha/beta hydrolase family esterase
MKQIILIHGSPEPGEEMVTQESITPDWFRWLKETLPNVVIPPFPLETEVVYQNWSHIMDQVPISTDTILVGHSCGGGFLIKYFSQHPEKKPKKIILVAPWIDPENYLKEAFPDKISYDETNRRLLVGSGFVENVDPQVWNYELSGKRVLLTWFSYRKANRERPIIGDRRAPSALGEIQPDHWLGEYTSELINVLNVLALLCDLEPQQLKVLEEVCSGPMISHSDLTALGAFEVAAAKPKKKKGSENQPDLIL